MRGESQQWKPDNRTKDIKPPWKITITSDECKKKHGGYCKIENLPCTEHNCPIKEGESK
jgi:hypothetical protein